MAHLKSRKEVLLNHVAVALVVLKSKYTGPIANYASLLGHRPTRDNRRKTSISGNCLYYL
jgi:hypothetical protein